jgi:indolepyruvate ferredoxin oxidoreductase
MTHLVGLVQVGEIEEPPNTLDAVMADRMERLSAYQNAAYASVYRERLEKVRVRDSRSQSTDSIAIAVARQLFRLMAYKDEYEVARLHSDDTFRRRIAEQFEGDFELRFNLAPPLLSKRDPGTGELAKREFGPWVESAFGLLAKLRFLRGTAFDLFGYTQERRQERADIDDYLQLLDLVLPQLDENNYDTVLELVRLPAGLRGFGHVKDRNREQMRVRKQALLERLQGDPASHSVVRIVEAA